MKRGAQGVRARHAELRVRNYFVARMDCSTRKGKSGSRLAPASTTASKPFSPLYMLSRPFAAFIKAARTPTLQAPTASLLARRTYSTPKKLRVPYPAMAAVSDQEIISRLGKLNIATPEVHKHAAVAGGAEWRAELDKIGQKGVQLTKTVRLSFRRLVMVIA